MGVERLALTVAEAAAAVGVSKDAVYDAVRCYELPAVRIRGRIVIPVAALEQLLRGGIWPRRARACAAPTAQPSDPVEYRATVRALRALAAHQEARQFGKELGTLARGGGAGAAGPARVSVRSPAPRC